MKLVYNKRSKSTSDIDVINKHLSDAREDYGSKADETINGDNVKLGVDEKHHPETRKMTSKTKQPLVRPT